MDWYKKLANFLSEQNFVGKNHYCLFSKNEKFIKLFVLSWLDDLVTDGSSLEAIEVLKKTLETRFKMDDWGNIEWSLGMQTSKDSGKITLDQETYIESVLKNWHAG